MSRGTPAGARQLDPRSMLLRWMTALAGIPVFVGLCLWGPVPFGIATAIVAALALAELLDAYEAAGMAPSRIAAAAGLFGPAYPLLAAPDELRARHPWLPAGTLETAATGVLILLVAAVVYEVARAARTADLAAGRRLAFGLLCAVCVALFGALSGLRTDTARVGTGVAPSLESGAALVLTLALAVWTADTLALFVGRAWGRRKLAPALSPGKTVAGAAGGLLGAVVVGALAGRLLAGSLPVGIAFGLAAGVFGQAGDLFMSALKREIGIKDFGAILPGHGGLLDRLDSLLLAAPVAALLAGILR